MKKLKHIFSMRSVIIWLLIIVLLLTVQEISKPAMSDTEAIVTMLCVENGQNNIEIAAVVLTPAEGKKPDYQVFTSSGKTLGEAIGNLGHTLGKEMGFAQCEVVVLGDKLCDSGVMPTLDYITRTKKVGRNSLLINCSGDIKDFADAIIKLDLDKSIKLSNVLDFDKCHLVSKDSSIKNFYKGYYSQIMLGSIPQFKLLNNENQEAIAVQAEQAAEENADKTEKKKYILNDGTMSVFKKGKRELIVDHDDMKKFNMLLSKNQNESIVVEHISDDMYEDATLVFDVSKKSVKFKPYFDQDKPVFSADIELTVTVEEANVKNPDEKFLVRNKEFLTNTAVEKLKEKVIEDSLGAIEFCKANRLDLINAYSYFYHLKYKKFSEYLQSVGEENFLDNIDFKINVKVNGEY